MKARRAAGPWQSWHDALALSQCECRQGSSRRRGGHHGVRDGQKGSGDCERYSRNCVELYASPGVVQVMMCPATYPALNVVVYRTPAAPASHAALDDAVMTLHRSFIAHRCPCPYSTHCQNQNRERREPRPAAAARTTGPRCRTSPLRTPSTIVA